MFGLLAKQFLPVQYHSSNVLSLINFYFSEFLKETCLENAMWGCSNKSDNTGCFDLIRGIHADTKEVGMVSSAQCPISFFCAGRKAMGKRKLGFQDIRCFFHSPDKKKALKKSTPV